MLFVYVDLESFFPWLLYISLEQNLLEQLLKVTGGKTQSFCL